MKEHPILFSTPMVRALLAGTKTQTRRVCKPAQAAGLSFVIEVPDPLERGQVYNGSHFGDEEGDVLFAVPYDGVGSRLWVRETHYLTDNGNEEFAVYAADEAAVREHLQRVDGLPANFPADLRARHRKLRSSIHMPRWASRITLEVTGVRVERLQDISEADAQAEGLLALSAEADRTWTVDGSAASEHERARDTYAWLWEQINGYGTWAANPWVWVIEFKRLEQSE